MEGEIISLSLIKCWFTHIEDEMSYAFTERAFCLVVKPLIERDAGHLIDCRARTKFSPLGACALADTGLPIDRLMISDALGFTTPMRNRYLTFYLLEINPIGFFDRDFLLEFLSANAITGKMSRFVLCVLLLQNKMTEATTTMMVKLSWSSLTNGLGLGNWLLVYERSPMNLDEDEAYSKLCGVRFGGLKIEVEWNWKVLLFRVCLKFFPLVAWLEYGLLECMMDPFTRVLVGFKFNGCLGVCFELIELDIGVDLELKLVVGDDSSSKRYKLYNQNSGKISINRGVEFGEEDFWDWSVQKDMYDFLPYFEEEEEEGMEQPMIEEHITPLASPTQRLDEISSSERTPRLRIVEELYEET
ncbi:hypothetical protein KIW84_050671 [Lathyrus oleraceus]|uniref:Retroviral polymerase SH3-like domain-containing protein n=1 Tax=Pisum sativum TaxID=3888 RepID=A0A9D5ACR8_PEA|nr:hypothetical protein KIW84_050671 [Pisum sativum]